MIKISIPHNFLVCPVLFSVTLFYPATVLLFILSLGLQEPKNSRKCIPPSV